MDFSFINPDQIKTFLLVLIRVMAFIMVLPFFGAVGVPSVVKIGLSLLVALIVAPSVPVVAVADEAAVYTMCVAREVIVGLMIGFSAIMFFSISNMAGGIVGLQIGLRMADIVDPFTNTTVSIIGELYFFTMTLLLFATDAHLALLKGVFDSFRFVPLTELSLQAHTMKKIVEIFVYTFNTGVQLAAPVLFLSIILNICQGLIARTAPEINILMIGFPVLIVGGILMLDISMPLAFALIKNALHRMIADTYALLRLM